jgi:hypothetical protein
VLCGEPPAPVSRPSLPKYTSSSYDCGTALQCASEIATVKVHETRPRLKPLIEWQKCLMATWTDSALLRRRRVTLSWLCRVPRRLRRRMAYEVMRLHIQHIQWQKCLMATVTDSALLRRWWSHGLRRAADSACRMSLGLSLAASSAAHL